MTTSRPRLSVSALRDYKFCGALYRFKKVLRVRPTGLTPLYLAVGNIVHHALYCRWALPVKDGFRVSWEVTGEDHPERARRMLRALWQDSPDDLEGEAERAAWALLMEDKTPWKDILITTGQTKALKDPDAAKRKVAWGAYFEAMLDKALGETLPGPVVEIERRVDYELGGIKMLGFIDIVCAAEDGTMIFVDVKTGMQAPSPAKLEHDLQVACYYVSGPSGFILWHLKSGLYPVRKNEALIEGLQRSVPFTADMIEAEIYLPRHDSECSPCMFRQQCLGE